MAADHAPPQPRPIDRHDHDRKDGESRRRSGIWRGQPLWVKALIGASVLLMITGIALPMVLDGSSAEPVAEHTPTGTDPQAIPSPGSPSSLAPGLAPTGGSGLGSDGPAVASSSSEPVPDDWSPTIFRLGFSFFVGFAIAFALRSFVKLSVVAIGLVLLLLFGLQYAGIIDVRWTVMEGHYDTFVGWLSAQTASFRDFVTGYLPSSASATAGLVVGFKRR